MVTPEGRQLVTPCAMRLEEYFTGREEYLKELGRH